MEKLTFGSLFAGIGGFDFGFGESGMKCVWQVEIDKQANAVRRKHWPNVEHFEDVREFHAEDAVRPDLICGGFPCQDLSVAGRRAGLAGERSGLFHEFMRIVAEFNPRWVCIENVPGLLSSNGGRDMGVVVGTLAKLGYRWAYRVLDAQFFGVAQRRRRVFIVGNLGDGPHPAEILFDSESLSRNPPTREKAGARVADCLTSGVASSRGVNRPGRRREDDTNIVTALSANGVGTCGADDNQAQGGHLIAGTLTSRNSPNGNGSAGPRVEDTFVPVSGPAVRRLTPRECERLQGFFDDFTRWDSDGNEISDSARYRMLGNAVAVPVARWIGRRIVEVLG